MENFGKFTSVLLALIISPIIHGFVVTKLWLWFIVPTFSADPLRIVEAIGLMFLINYLKPDKTEPANENNFWNAFTKKIIDLLSLSIVVLFAGWVVKMFM